MLQTKESARKNLDKHWSLIVWDMLKANEFGDAHELGYYSGDLMVQFDGAFGTATVNLFGSIDGRNFHHLTDLQDWPISRQKPGLKKIQERVRFIKPVVVGGDSVTAIVCRLLIDRGS